MFLMDLCVSRVLFFQSYRTLERSGQQGQLQRGQAALQSLAQDHLEQRVPQLRILCEPEYRRLKILGINLPQTKEEQTKALSRTAIANRIECLTSGVKSEVNKRKYRESRRIKVWSGLSKPKLRGPRV